jgi:hypothetical protein
MRGNADLWIDVLIEQFAAVRHHLAEVKELLLADDQRVEIATKLLPVYIEVAGVYSDFAAFLRALQVGADGAA